MNCKCCGQPLREWVQPSYWNGRAAMPQVDCWNGNCSLYSVTLAPEDHAALTNEQVQGYARARVRQWERERANPL